VLPHPNDEEMTAPAPTPIVPRWEWRTFDERFGEADIHFAALSPDRAQESDEVYLLSLASDASVKVRDAPRRGAGHGGRATRARPEPRPCRGRAVRVLSRRQHPSARA